MGALLKGVKAVESHVWSLANFLRFFFTAGYGLYGKQKRLLCAFKIILKDASKSRWRNSKGQSLHLWNNEKKCVFIKKRSIEFRKWFLTVSWDLHDYLMVSLILYSSGSNARGKPRALQVSETVNTEC